MLKTISPQDMREMEMAFLKGTLYPSILLMEHAAQAVVDELAALVPPNARVLFVCGSGNNGGDGCAAARLWLQRGGQADVWLMKSPSQMKGDAGVNAGLLSSCGASLTVLYGDAPELPDDCAAIVDAIYGTGLSREIAGAALSAVRRMNESGLPVISVDIPSGVDGATGNALGEAVQATVTVAFHRAKHGHMLFPGRALTGRLVVADIGILGDWDGAQGYDILNETDLRSILPERPMDGHKGTFGHVLCVAGSGGMAGAACLCAGAALRSGAGLVTAACTLPVLLPLQISQPCAMAKAVCAGNSFDVTAADALVQLAKGKRALAIGPGLGVSEETYAAILSLLESDMPKVVDADALNMLAAFRDIPFFEGANIDFHTLQSLFWGELFLLAESGTMPAEKQFAKSADGDKVTLVNADSRLAVLTFIVNAIDGLVRQVAVSSHRTGVPPYMTWDYVEFSLLGEKKFPTRHDISIAAGSRPFKATLSLSNLRNDSGWETRTDISGRSYKEITADKLMSYLMNLNR